MVSLLIVILVLQVAIYLINTIGAKTINDLAWLIYTRLPLAASKLPREQLVLRNEVLKLKRDMHGTSSQDEFAKWAKLRRQHDKKQAEYDEKTSQIQSHRSTFDKYASSARWVATAGLLTFLQFWNSKTPVFTYPRGWLPWYVEWILGFPRAPYGSVSVQVWGSACAVVVEIIGTSISAILIKGLATRQEQMKAETKQQTMKMSAGGREKEEAEKEL
ncbi:putative chd5 domain-containing protein [Phaeomoniella chlamydospora]|uniref:Putative chd5 domain-containing protein n=1 Tax=Phaeomoniella chlamydospora TaxID=158046 RepID=A0A0G2ERZ2_PHACM|nr:putative chd5 domain-containing protein [Phaeomoniella chlamydospora]